MRGSAIRSVRSQWQSHWDRRNFAPLPLPNPYTNLDVASNISPRPQGVDVQNLIKIDSAVAALRMREKTRYRVRLFVNISIRSSPRLQAAFLARF